MKELWDFDYEAVGKDWDNLYRAKYMEHIARAGLGFENQVVAATSAYEHACREIMTKYNMNFKQLEKTIDTYSSIINGKPRPESRRRRR